LFGTHLRGGRTFHQQGLFKGKKWFQVQEGKIEFFMRTGTVLCIVFAVGRVLLVPAYTAAPKLALLAAMLPRPL
jgi:hypothetical protein